MPFSSVEPVQTKVTKLVVTKLLLLGEIRMGVVGGALSLTVAVTEVFSVLGSTLGTAQTDWVKAMVKRKVMTSKPGKVVNFDRKKVNNLVESRRAESAKEEYELAMYSCVKLV